MGRFCDLDLGDRFQERGTNYRQNEIKEKGDEKGEGGMQQRMMRDWEPIAIAHTELFLNFENFYVPTKEASNL